MLQTPNGKRPQGQVEVNKVNILIMHKINQISSALGLTVLCTLGASAVLPLMGQDFLNNGLVAYYPLTNGSTADQLGNGNLGVLENGAVFANGPSGQPNSAVRLDGASAYVYFGKNDAVYPNQILTWSIWFNPAAFDGTILWDDDSQNDGDRLIRLSPSGALLAETYSQLKLESTNVLALHRWHQATFTSDTNGSSLYLDGVLQASAKEMVQDHAGRSSLSIGAANCDCSGPNMFFLAYPPFTGSLANLRIYNRSLTASEVKQLYESEAPDRLTIATAAVRMRWFAESGVSYHVQWSSDMQGWSDVSTVLGSGAETNVVDWTDGPRRFYRLIKQ